MAYNNPELLSFFKELQQEVFETVRLDCQEDIEKLGQCFELAQKYGKKIDEIAEKLSATGITLSDRREHALSSTNIRFERSGMLSDYNGRILKVYVPVDYLYSFTSFNGMHLSIEDVKNPETSSQKRDYDYQSRVSDGFAEEESELKLQLENYEKRLRFPTFKRKEIEEKIRKIKNRLVYISMEHETTEELESLSDEHFVERNLPEVMLENGDYSEEDRDEV